jgi:glycosyltransferase involved in cell wall biosynthesis
MLLINRIEVSDLNNYRQEYLECLKHNISNTLITKILIYTDEPGHNIPKLSSKVDIFYKKNSSIVDVIENAKRISSTENIIFSNPLCKFNSDIFKVFPELPHNIITDGRDYFIFHKSIFLSNVPNLSGIFPLNRKNISLNVDKATINQIRRVITPTKQENVKQRIINRPIVDNRKDLPQITEKREVLNSRNVEKKKFVKDLGQPTIIKRKGVIPESNSQSNNRVKKLDVVIVSVNYNDLLLVSLQHNSKIFDNITVVTSNDDLLCQKICQKFGVNYVITDVMYDENAIFNKGKAINEGVKSLKDPDFILLIDADIVIKDKIDVNELNENILYSSDRWICKSYNLYNQWQEGTLTIEKIGRNEGDKGIGFFQLFNISNSNIDKEKPYPEMSNNAAWSDLVFRDKFVIRNKVENTIIHLGDPYKNWDGRITRRFLTDEQFDEILNKKSTFIICSFYFNYNNDWRQKRNFIKFLEQWKDYYDNLIVGIVDYGDIDFEIPCDKIVIEGDINKKIWSKEILINKIVEKIDTDYIIWVDGDIIYENLNWLNDLDNVIGNNDFVQLFETINYLGENGELLETHKSLASGESKGVDNLLSRSFKPGGSWMTRTKILKSKPLFEKMLVGGGDTILAYALCGVENGWTLQKVKEGSNEIYEEAKIWISNFGKRKVGYLPISVNHLYHGDLKDRNYNDRYKKLNKTKNHNFSIIITAFKTEDFIEECLDSIKDQSYFNNFEEYEILLGIDACHRTLEKVKSISKKYDKLKILFFNENIGTYIVSNTLINMAKYQNIIRFDSDDIMKNDMIEQISNYVESYDMIRFNCQNFSDYSKNNKINLSYGCIYFKKELFNCLGGFKPWPCSADKDFVQRASSHKIKNIDIVLFNRRIHENSLTRNSMTNSNSEIRKMYNQMISNSFESVELVENLNFKIVEKVKLLFIYDVEGWAFHKMSLSIKEHLSQFYIDILRFDEIFESKNYDLIICFSPNVLPKYERDYEKIVCGISSHKPDITERMSKFKYVFSNDINLYEKLKNQNKFYLPNGIDCKKFEKLNKKIDKSKINIATIGSLSRSVHKGIERIKKIKEILNSQGYYVIDNSLFVDPFSENKLNDVEIIEYYKKNIDILLISSVSETGPNILLEAMSLGIPVVANKTGLCSEIIKSGENGFLIENFDDLDEYVKKIKILIENDDIYEKFSKNSNFSIKKWDWSIMSSNYSNMIKSILKI